MVFMVHSQSVHKLVNGRVVLVCTSTTFVPISPELGVQMVNLMELFPCSGSSMPRRAMLTRRDVARDPSPSISNRGTQISWTSWSYASIKVMRKHVAVTFSRRCGFLTYS